MSQSENQYTLRSFWLIVFAAIFALGVVILYNTLLMPLGMSLLFAYLLMPFVDFLVRTTKLSRAYSCFIIVAVSLALIISFLVILFPTLRKQIVSIWQMIPIAKDFILDSLLPDARALLMRFDLFSQKEIDNFIGQFAEFARIGKPLGDAAQRVLYQSGNVVSSIINAALVPLFSFFILRDWPLLGSKLKELVPIDLLSVAYGLQEEIDRCLRAVIKGQVTVAAILAVLYVIGFSVVGLSYGAAIGIAAGFCRIVPYFDVIMALVLSLVVLVIDPSLGWGVGLGVIIVIALVQAIDGLYITPRVIGEKVGLHPAVVIASVVAFGDWMGFWGILLAIPIVAVAKVISRYAFNAYRHSPFFLNSSLEAPE